MPRSLRSSLILLILLPCFLIVGYQNCGDVRVAPHEEIQVASKTSRLAGDFCAGTVGGDLMRIQSFTLVNLTAKPTGNKVLADSDMDGTPDEHEVRNAAFGFIKTEPYSTGILDGVCASQGGSTCVPATCDRRPLSFGLLNCDATAISSSTTLTGVDTDMDGIPDLIEVLRGLDPLRAVLDEDNDMLANGSKSNLDEIQRGLDPKSSQDVDVSLRVATTYTKQIKSTAPGAIDPCGNQDRYSFNVSSFPLVDVEASINPYFPELSHDKNVNVMMAYYVAYPLDSTKMGRIFYQMLYVNKDAGDPTLRLDPAGFKLLGTFTPPRE